MKIKDSVIIITGASGGIGLAAARELAKRGARVVLAARSRDKIAALEKELPGSLAIPTDMRTPEEVRRLIDETKRKFCRIDVLINNAGQGLRASVGDIDMNEYRSIMELNVFAALEAMQAVIPVMREQGGGMILNISSLVSKYYFPSLAAYASTKYALNALTLTAREELAREHIVVSAFHPKMTATEFGANALGTPYSSAAGRPGMNADAAEEVAAKIAGQIESEEAEVQM
ncbi:MAG TPA: SDR family oxidoreductase [Candidatus Paceibacterota bacterium]|nr:SDR family oxidoreductase [Candidatus Paceibacterota bacterium]